MEEISFIPQCKGTDADKVNIGDDDLFYCSIKYYGVYIQIQKVGDEVVFLTSSGKAFKSHLEDEFKKIDFDFKIECEYIIGDGKLDATMLGKADNEIKKVVKDNSFKLTGKFMIFDVIALNSHFKDRIYLLNKFQTYTLQENDVFDVVQNDFAFYKEVKQGLKYIQKEGWEGYFLKKKDHLYIAGKESKDAIKLKPKYTVDLLVVEIKNNWLWCKDSEGRIAKVQTGWDIAEETKIGDIVEIQYEQIAKTYVQAVYVRHRYDKMA